MIPDATYENWYEQTGRIYGCRATGKAKPGGGHPTAIENKGKGTAPVAHRSEQRAGISWDFPKGAAVKRKKI